MHTSLWTTENEHQAKAASVRQYDTDQTCESDKAPTMHWTAITECQESIDSDSHDSQDDQILVELDVFTQRIHKSLDTKQMDCHMFSIFLPFISHVMHMFLPTDVWLPIDLRVSAMLNNISVRDSICACYLVISYWLLIRIYTFVSVVLLVYLNWFPRRCSGRNFAKHSGHINEVCGVLEDLRITSGCMDLVHVLFLRHAINLVRIWFKVVKQVEKHWTRDALWSEIKLST